MTLLKEQTITSAAGEMNALITGIQLPSPQPYRSETVTFIDTPLYKTYIRSEMPRGNDLPRALGLINHLILKDGHHTLHLHPNSIALFYTDIHSDGTGYGHISQWGGTLNLEIRDNGTRFIGTYKDIDISPGEATSPWLRISGQFDVIGPKPGQ